MCHSRYQWPVHLEISAKIFGNVNCNEDDDYGGDGDKDNAVIDDNGNDGGDDKDQTFNHLGVSHSGHLSIDLPVKGFSSLPISSLLSLSLNQTNQRMNHHCH